MATSTIQDNIPKAVQELSAAASAVHDAQQVNLRNCSSVLTAERIVTTQTIPNNTRKWGEVSKIVRQIDTCVSNTAKAAYHRGERADLPLVSIAALDATK